MFDRLEMAPPDPILGLTAAFRADANPNKINLGVGVYQNASGKTPILETVKEAEKRLLEQESTKDYLSIEGEKDYAVALQKLILGEDHSILKDCRAATAQTPGGTGALRVAAEFLQTACDARRIWVSDPTWANHNNIFEAAGLEIATYPYYDAASKSLDFAGMIGALGEIPEGEVVLVHGCCHNPTGLDPDVEQWKQIAKMAGSRKLVLLVDLAYQGLAVGLDEDAQGVRILGEKGSDMLIASSF